VQDVVVDVFLSATKLVWRSTFPADEIDKRHAAVLQLQIFCTVNAECQSTTSLLLKIRILVDSS